ncbi:MAG TPA: hypothetical protein VFR14_08520 [Candidatus Limnocylindrales bacterium]|nr:hypothetical protein [Candidatus Limnocylindrales bacterium]
MKLLRAGSAALLLLALVGVGSASAHEPTCSDVGFLGIEVHGQHVVRDYVMGGGLESWPPKGGVVGAATAGGAALPGGPGPAFHFANGVAPGASFCTNSNSPGAHL